MQVKDVITGKLTPMNQNITGALSTSDILSGNLISSAIISGTILATGTIDGELTIPPEKYVDPYVGEYTVVSKPFRDEVLKTAGHSMTNNVTVLQIPYYETSNQTGYTIYIGGE